MLSPRATFNLEERQRQKIKDLERRLNSVKSSAGPTAASIGAARKVARTITGDGAQTNFTIEHNFDTRDVVIQIWQTASPYEQMAATISLPTERTAVISFGAAPGAGETFRVVVFV